MDRLTGDALARLVKALGRKAGLAREVRPHALRHEAITRALDLCAGDDLVLKAEQFKPLRDKLLRGAADFYGKLEGLLKGQPDRASRGAMGNAYFELGELTAKIGDKPAALAAHRNGLAGRRELASDPANDAKAREDVAKSLTRPRSCFPKRASRPRPSPASRRRVSCWRACPSQARVPTGAAPCSAG